MNHPYFEVMERINSLMLKYKHQFLLGTSILILQLSHLHTPTCNLSTQQFKFKFNPMNTTNTSTSLTVPSNPYLHSTPAPPPPPKPNNITRRVESAAKKAENLAENLYNHLRTGPGFIDVAMTRIDQAARVIAEGGCNKVFKKEFGDVNGEKLKESFVCYLSTTTGPVLGTLYVSNQRVCFMSDNPVWNGSHWVYYKVVLMAEQVISVNPSSGARPGDKYIVVLTKDGHEFWFMGFVFYDKALKNMNKLIQHWK